MISPLQYTKTHLFPSSFDKMTEMKSPQWIAEEHARSVLITLQEMRTRKLIRRLSAGTCPRDEMGEPFVIDDTVFEVTHLYCDTCRAQAKCRLGIQ